MNNLRIVEFCAKECERQNSGELSVSNMFNAYCSAKSYMNGDLTEDNILNLGALVDPDKNMYGYRGIPVSFANGKILDKPGLIPHQIESLIRFQDVISADMFYQRFEEIHPFVDGNGRVGAILFNWKMDSLDNPIVPPEFVS